MGAVFVERRFELGPDHQVTLSLYRPRPDGDAWRCEYRIQWPGRERTFYGAGADSMQALISAMQNAHADLLSSPEAQAGALTWFGERDLDLPLARGFTPEDFA